MTDYQCIVIARGEFMLVTYHTRRPQDSMGRGVASTKREAQAQILDMLQTWIVRH